MRRTLTTLAAMLASVAFAFAALDGAVLADGQTMQFDPASKSVNYDDGQFKIQVVAGGALNMGGFGFDLNFDRSILKVVNAAIGPMLGSTGRQPACLPLTELIAGVQYGCFTNGPSPDGPSGDGVLVVLTFQPLAHGSTALTFSHMAMPDINGDAPTPATNTAAITVNGGPDPQPAPTPPPQSLVGVPTPPSGGHSSQPGSDSAAAPPFGTLGGTQDTPIAGSGTSTGVSSGGGEAGSASGAGGASDSAGSGGGGAVAGASSGQPAGNRSAGKFGTGPENHGDASGSWLTAAVFLAIIGAALLAAGGLREVRR